MEHGVNGQALADRLTALTRKGEIAWEEPTNFGIARASYRGVEYLLDCPKGSNNDLMLYVDGIVVWEGFGLMVLRNAVMDAQPAVPAPQPEPVKDYRAPEALRRALRSLED